MRKSIAETLIESMKAHYNKYGFSKSDIEYLKSMGICTDDFLKELPTTISNYLNDYGIYYDGIYESTIDMTTLLQSGESYVFCFDVEEMTVQNIMKSFISYAEKYNADAIVRRMIEDGYSDSIIELAEDQGFF